MVQTLTRALKTYVADINQKDWDEYAKRLTFALNTAYDRIRASVLRLRYSGHGIDFGPPDDALQTYLRKIKARAPGLLDQDALQRSLKTNR
ncbi:hypothetical protein L914_21451 [Phytophthora nicotianae]|uniref:Uncharacterized protein n=1 Tax=Phytophthora nicotianae TaxID=4792 RepID=W2M5U6_PHYNI|nr:hypothetical protein L914_21451 [Phytophthora nicotianae]